MSEEVKPEVISETQKLLGKYFKSPPLTEKLLKKPPFRFLHDIISAVIRETGFLQGLFSEEELNSDNVKDKDSKLAYLTKLIEVVKLATGDNLTVRPSKIVSGQEPTKTNELLQSIGRALDKKINSKDAIEQYKTNKSKPKSDKNDAKKASKASHHKKSTDSTSPSHKKISNTEKEKEKENGKIEKENKVKEEKIAEPGTSEPKVERQSSSKPKKATTSKAETENATKSTKERKKSISESSDSSKRPRSTKESASTKKRKPIKLQSSNSIPENEVVETKSSNVPEIENPKDPPKTEDENQKEEKKVTAEEPVKEETEVAKPIEISSSNEIARPRTSLRPPSARPPSARPAAPKMKAKTDFIINEEIISPAGNVNVIVENFDTKDDNADDMVVMEAPRDPMQMQGIDKLDTQLSQEHGHLVAQILETQKELINTENVDVLPKKVEIEWEVGSRRDRDATVKEVDKLRTTIQTLTRATNPLRKLLDFVQEDVEIMQKELRDWQLQYEEFSEELEIEQSQTEQSIEPMKESLEELKNNIKQQLSKIGQVKMNIIKNDQKIQRLLNGNF